MGAHITFPCDHCSAAIKVRDEQVGKKVRCEQCGQAVLVPSTAGANPFAELNAAGGVPSSSFARGDAEHESEFHKCSRCGSNKGLRRYECYPYDEQLDKAVPVNAGHSGTMYVPAYTNLRREVGHCCKACAASAQRSTLLTIATLSVILLGSAAAAAVYASNTRDGSRLLIAFIAIMSGLAGCASAYWLLIRWGDPNYSGAAVVAQALAATMPRGGVLSRGYWELLYPRQRPAYFVEQLVREVPDQHEAPSPARTVKLVTWNKDAQQYVYVLEASSRPSCLFLAEELEAA